MNYIDALDFLEETMKYGSQLGLTSIQNLMAELGNIQDKIPLVHIGGTNGKGSVGAMLSQVLTEAGYRVGRPGQKISLRTEKNMVPFKIKKIS